MEIDSMDKDEPYVFPEELINQLFGIYGNLFIEENGSFSSEKKNTIYTLSDISFHNRGSKAKNRMFIGSTGIFSSSKQNSNDSQQKENEQENIQSIPVKKKSVKKMKRMEFKIINSYGPSFNTEIGSNLCFFNQSLQLILHCQFIYDWLQEKTPSKIKSECLINLYFIAHQYYNMSNDCLFEIIPAYQILVDLCLKKLNLTYGDMGDISDAIEAILSQFHFETPSTKKNYTSAFEIDFEYINYDNSEITQIYSNSLIIYNIEDQYSMPCSCVENVIIIPEIKSFAKKYNNTKWINYNLQYNESTQSYVPFNTREMKSLSESIQASFYPKTNQVYSYKKAVDSGNHPELIVSDNINYCIQTFNSFPAFLIIKINYIQSRTDNLKIDQKLIFQKLNSARIEYELIGLIYFSINHYFSLFVSHNNGKGSKWILYNDTIVPQFFEGLFEDAIIYFNLGHIDPCIVLYAKY